MTAPAEVLELVERFDRNLRDYKNGKYNETQVRREFIDPLFMALGWDVDNTKGYAEAYKDVIHEDALKVGGVTKAPDYCFRIGGARKFFLEAKKPSVNIRNDVHPAFQLRRYAWSAKLPLSVLTDFEELAVYDCRMRPVKNDKSSKARIQYITYDQYPDRWDEISGIFHRQSVLQGSFDKYVESTKRKKGTAEVDDEFLKEIESWRDLLARNIALRNPGLTQRNLNFCVQRTIDRIIFLRICEDRRIEKYGRLQSLLNGGQVYGRLLEQFKDADDRYNSGLFHFNNENGRATEPDQLTPGLTIDDKALKEIVKRLYYPDSPYEFSVLPADILGQVYEQFLGKVIRLSGKRAVVEEKPEVRKAGGVYYTPTYIVDYIVKNTVGKLLEGSTPKKAEKLRILDPACGSGSFLIRAYQYLLDWHLDYYQQKGTKNEKKRIYEGARGVWKLTTDEKKRILLNNIYGVDIDPQAVEVTKLSLLLKVMEGADAELFAMYQKRFLPDLGGNIKCGNSLIGSDFYQGQQLTMLDEEEMYRINAFDWDVEFADIMKAGGFDAVIGNPPYIRIQAMKEWAPKEVEFYKQKYVSASKGNYDIYVVFVEKGLGLLNPKGSLGFILPHKFFNAQYGQPLRGIISAGKHLRDLVHFGDQQVFQNATTYTCLMFLNRSKCDAIDVQKVKDLEAWRNNGEGESGEVSSDTLDASEWNFVIGKGADLFRRLSEMPVKLGDVAGKIAQGIRTSKNEVYVLEERKHKKNSTIAYSKQLDSEVEIESNFLHPFLQGREIKSYRIKPSGKKVIIPYDLILGKASLMPEKLFRSQYPLAFQYLTRNRKVLEDREKGRMRGKNWYGYVYPKNIEVMKSPKILVPDIADRAAFALDEEGVYVFTSGYGITFKTVQNESVKYFLGLLNSAVLDFYLKHVSTSLRGGFFRYFAQYIEQLPIRTIDFDDSADVERHDRMVQMVEAMLDMNKKLAEARTDDEKKFLQRRIDATDKQIDQLVYELYGLTEEEIAIVEEG